MSIFLNASLLILGFIALIKGADWFVDGSSSLAKTFKVPSVIIGLTIVALGTSAPELAVSTSAAISGSNEIAFSNVLGSNMFNLLAVLGICAMIKPIPIDRQIVKRDFPFSIVVTLGLLAYLLIKALTGNANLSGSMLQNVGTVSRIASIILLLLFVGYLVFLITSALKNRNDAESNEEKTPVWKSVLFIVIGLICIVAGGQLVVNNAKDIAAALGMSETLIGLTIVAVGTSLPELVTSIVASRKGENGLAVGNVVGSNIFNILLILGVSSTVHPVSVNLASLYDLMILSIISVVVFIFSKTKNINRIEGGALVLIYIGEVVFSVLR